MSEYSSILESAIDELTALNKPFSVNQIVKVSGIDQNLLYRTPDLLDRAKQASSESGFDGAKFRGKIVPKEEMKAMEPEATVTTEEQEAWKFRGKVIPKEVEGMEPEAAVTTEEPEAWKMKQQINSLQRANAVLERQNKELKEELEALRSNPPETQPISSEVAIEFLHEHRNHWIAEVDRLELEIAGLQQKIEVAKRNAAGYEQILTLHQEVAA
ncbi:hypothetical protein NIES2135_20460 [Leptolyngbya boryana NIES-2135]|jgi:cell division protein FtsB|uniref:Uncharacterized protein n=1 Tax=Leptolyngbya boryana NIES-2135 TaxID=1973484 RepID=A0A1Z4JEZ4_LEPBY|nr:MULTISPECIES: hypothetical protein [Leptolyngbya]BAY55223.1 hypothetical protein NIES2135_20460 [Leptolyngbya boryana NIES-2135]MBD2369310.1 hypothetical protein [Leptolyngbya sp. FACHB-161]MBD2375688.1 hypothetical protein [Leptolyngbya sp. FACHB-238]MBD2401037.1 hypothetical protein [Leptolyngbya sp. FACHB-239]MBD2406622.1 hypothetical protein [Leptolyngbya sp. FACHB-402]